MSAVRAALLCLALAATSASADARSDAASIVRQGQSAFDAGDYARAGSLWADAAAQGATEGTFGLAVLSDGGYGRPRDAAVAFGLYLSAAQAGLARAQFNVAVMLDAGLGTERDAGAAMEWYTRAALRGNARAQYNLGLMIEAGTVGPPDPERATLWFAEAAAALPAAAAKLRTRRAVASTEDGPTAPALSFAARKDGRLELIWTADGSGDTFFTVEILPLPAVDGAGMMTIGTRMTGVLTDDPLPTREVAIRVVRSDVARREYAASDWSLGVGPVGLAEMTTLGTDPAMLRFASTLTADLRASGIQVRSTGPGIATATGDPSATSRATAAVVVYGWRSDAELAARVAGLLPYADEGAARFDPAVDLRPGEVRVRIGDGG